MNKNGYGKWISSNRVLGGSMKSPNERARNPNFDFGETKLLISIWGNPIIQKKLLTVPKKQPIIKEIAEQMKAKGYNRTAEEINTRIKNLKCLYNRIRKEMESGHLQSSPQWKHFAAMHEILSRPLIENKAFKSAGGNTDFTHPELQIADVVNIPQRENNERIDFEVEDDANSSFEDIRNYCEANIKIEPADEEIM